MKNETVVEVEKLERKAGLTSATLPWWAKVLIAQHLGQEIPPRPPRHVHHCLHCDCIMVCQYRECRDLQMCCPECNKKNRSSQGGN